LRCRWLLPCGRRFVVTIIISLVARPSSKGENDYWNKAILAGQMSAGAEKAARQGKKPNLRQASDEQLITPA
jgi:hypothetical protein